MSIALGTGLAIAGIASVGASVAGGEIASHGATTAANIQATAATTSADKALEFQKQQYADAQTREAPYVASGVKALGELNAMPGFQAPGADFTKDPGYEFRLAEGQKALERSAAAKGGALGGAALKAAESYGQGVASDEYSNVYARRFNEYNQQFNQLASKAGVGQTATSNLDILGANAATREGNTTVEGMNNAAAARASGVVNSANTLGTSVKSGTNAILDWYRTRPTPTSFVSPNRNLPDILQDPLTGQAYA